MNAISTREKVYLERMSFHPSHQKRFCNWSGKPCKMSPLLSLKLQPSSPLDLPFTNHRRTNLSPVSHYDMCNWTHHVRDLPLFFPRESSRVLEPSCISFLTQHVRETSCLPVPMSVMFDRVTFLCILSLPPSLTLFMCVYSFILYFTSAPFIHSLFHLFLPLYVSLSVSIVSIPLLFSVFLFFLLAIRSSDSFIQILSGQGSDLMWRRKGTSGHERWSFYFQVLLFLLTLFISRGNTLKPFSLSVSRCPISPSPDDPLSLQSPPFLQPKFSTFSMF